MEISTIILLNTIGFVISVVSICYLSKRRVPKPIDIDPVKVSENMYVIDSLGDEDKYRE